MKNFRSILLFLLLPLMFTAYYEEARIRMPGSSHTFIEILILVVICMLALKIVDADEVDRLREIQGTFGPRYYHISKGGEEVWHFEGKIPSQAMGMEGTQVGTAIDKKQPLYDDSLNRHSQVTVKSGGETSS